MLFQSREPHGNIRDILPARGMVIIAKFVNYQTHEHQG